MENDIKFLIENVKEPFVMDGLLDWELLKWDLDKWKNVLGQEELEFRKGKIAYTKVPQWERSTEHIKGTFVDFLTFVNNKDEWLYFDYKQLNQWLLNANELKSEICWKNFGYPDAKSEDSTIWIGSKGAHTPCHMDTYGFNLVGQIYGRKRWLLFPPEENLQTTRIPYEESSIYSKINFYSPKINQCKVLSNCRTIVLEPGKVLYVPNGWWHYVENIEIAISINTWLPYKSDDETRTKEAVVQMMMKAFTADMSRDDQRKILNPNEGMEYSIYDTFKVLKNCLDKQKGNSKYKKRKIEGEQLKNVLESEKNVNEILLKRKNSIKILKNLPNNEFLELIRNQSERFAASDVESENEDTDMLQIINACTNDDVINVIKEKLIK